MSRVTIAVDLAKNVFECVFRRKPATDSGPFRPPIPEQSGHRFR